MLSCNGLLFLALIGMHVTHASVKKLEDNTMQLISPWTDAEHSLACPPQDPRPCPVLSMNAPVISVAVPSETVLIRQVASLSASEIQQGATTPFFLYNYMYFSEFCGKRYAVHDGPEQVMLTFETSMGRTWYHIPDAESCKVITGSPKGSFIITADDPTVFTEEATLKPGPLRWSVTGTIPQVNCLLGSIRFSKSGGKLNSQNQMSLLGGLSTLKIFVGDGVNRNEFGSAFRALTVIYYETIQAQPILNKCPTFSYPYPNSRQISLPAPGLPDLEQPVAIASWAASQLQSEGPFCFSTPMATYPEKLPEIISCPRDPINTYPTCRPCGVSRSDWFYVFEDSPTVMTLSGLTIDDSSFFSGSVRMSMELVFERDPPTFEREGGSMKLIQVSARQGNPSAFTYCAQSQRGDKTCALSREEAVGKVWVPPPNAWGTTYQMRIVEEAEDGIFCVPGTPDCPVTADKLLPGKFVCKDPGEIEGDVTLCPCKSGLCYTINSLRRARSRNVSPEAGRSRLWFQVHDMQLPDSDPARVVQNGYLDVYIGQGGEVSGQLHAYPKSRGGMLDWFSFSPLDIFGTFDSRSKRMLLSSVVTSSRLHPPLVLNISTNFGLLDFPDKSSHVVKVPDTPAASVSLRGNLYGIMAAIGRIEDQVDHRKYRNLNTQVKGAPESEHITFTYDKSEASRARKVIDAGVGSVTVFHLPLVILATNDLPNISIPTHVNATENKVNIYLQILLLSHQRPSQYLNCKKCKRKEQVVKIEGVRVYDADAEEVFVNANGHVFIFEKGRFRDGSLDKQILHEILPSCDRHIWQQLLQKRGEVKCGPDDLPLC